MKKIIIVLVSILVSLSVFADNVNSVNNSNANKIEITQNEPTTSTNITYSENNYSELPAYSQQIDCTLTITVTINGGIGSASASLSVSGPCDEVLANADALFDTVLALAKKKWDAL